MAKITDATEAFSAGTAITKAEFWQVTEGAAEISTDSSPNPGDGVMVERPYGLQFEAGVTIKYRKLTASPCVITRTATST